MRRFALLPATAVLVLTARADVDLEVRSGDRVQGTIDPVSEVETLRFSVPAGAKLRLRAAGAKKGPAVGATVRTPEGAVAGEGTRKGRAAVVSGLGLPASGTWSADVVAAGAGSGGGAATGDYTASVAWTSPRRFGPETVTLGTDAKQTVTFSADAGARVRIVAKAAKGSAARPHVIDVHGPAGTLDSGADAAGGVVDKVGPFLTDATGDHVVSIDDTGEGGEGGEVIVTVQVTPPRASRRRIDVRAAALGGAGGTDGAYARVAGPEGGVIEVPSDVAGLDAIEGSSILVPAGALPTGVALVIGTAAPLDVPGADETALGPTVSFGPEGTTFGTRSDPVSVTLSIPIDLSAVGGATDAVTVWVRDAKGRVTQVPPPYDFSRTGYVSFPTSHFSAYRAVATQGGGQAPLNPITLASGGTARDFDFAFSLSSVPDADLIVANGTAETVSVVTRGGPGTPPSVVSFAGGGASTADGTFRTDFDFQGAVTAVASGANGDVFVGTPTRVFRIAPDGAVTRFAGTGSPGDAGDGGAATAAQFSSCDDLLVTLSGDVFLLDGTSARVRQFVFPSATAGTVVGTGTATFGADGEPIPLTTFGSARSLAFRPGGGFYVCDGGRVRAINPPQSTNVTVAGDPAGALGAVTGNVTAAAARFRDLSGISVSPNGVLFVADQGAHTVVRIDLAQDLVTTVIGTPDTEGAVLDGTFPVFTAAPRRVLVAGDAVHWIESPGSVRRLLVAP